MAGPSILTRDAFPTPRPIGASLMSARKQGDHACNLNSRDGMTAQSPIGRDGGRCHPKAIASKVLPNHVRPFGRPGTALRVRKWSLALPLHNVLQSPDEGKRS